MVKTLGSLPNVVYVLAYDRQIVWQSLDQQLEFEGPSYAEKIVQQEIELPKPSKHALLSILDQEISFLTANVGQPLRWQYLVRDGIRRWIERPRDVHRLSNAVKFSWPALASEIDPQDLLAMEGLRLFDSAAFKWIHGNRDFIFGEGQFQLADDEVRKAAVENLTRSLPTQGRDQVLRVLGTLFPNAAKWLEGDGFGREPFIEVVKRRGVGSEAGYDAYFGLRPSSDEVPKTVIDSIFSESASVERLVAIVGAYFDKTNSRGEPMIGKVVDELSARFEGRDPAEPNQNLFDAIFHIGERVIALKWTGEMFTLSPRARISFLVGNMLKLWKEPKRSNLLISTFERAGSPAFCASVFVDRGSELGIFGRDSREPPLISEETFDRLGKILLDKISAAAADGSLYEAPFYYDIARSWAYLDVPDYPRSWIVSGAARDAQILANVARGLINDVYSTSGHHYEMREAPDRDLYDLEALLESARKHLSEDHLDQDTRNLLSELKNGIEKHLHDLAAKNSSLDQDSDAAYSAESSAVDLNERSVAKE
jgi:hypothetical protein